MFMIPGTARCLLEFILVIFSVQDDMARSSDMLTYAFVEHVLHPTVLNSFINLHLMRTLSCS
jgi:hypothetical protein